MSEGLLLNVEDSPSVTENAEKESSLPIPTLTPDVPQQPEATTQEGASQPTAEPVPEPGSTIPEKPLLNGTHTVTKEATEIKDETAADEIEDVKEQVEEKPQDPRLKEIENRFGGRWRMVRSDPYDEYLKTLGVGFFSRKFAGRAYHDLDVTVTNDAIIVDMRSFFHSQHYTFKLDEEVENLVEKSKHGVVCTYEGGKLIQQMTPLDPACNKTQQVERNITELGEHEVIFTAGEAVCKRYYARLPEAGCKEASKPDSSKAKTSKSEEPNNQAENTNATKEISAPVGDCTKEASKPDSSKAKTSQSEEPNNQAENTNATKEISAPVGDCTKESRGESPQELLNTSSSGSPSEGTVSDYSPRDEIRPPQAELESPTEEDTESSDYPRTPNYTSPSEEDTDSPRQEDADSPRQENNESPRIEPNDSPREHDTESPRQDIL